MGIRTPLPLVRNVFAICSCACGDTDEKCGARIDTIYPPHELTTNNPQYYVDTNEKTPPERETIAHPHPHPQNPTCAVTASQGCEGLWMYDYDHA